MRIQEPRKGAEGTTVRLEIASRIEMLEAADVLVSHLARVAGFADDAVDDIRVSVDEAVANAITHGNRFDASKRVALEIELGPEALVVRVEDEGGGFDPAGVSDPLALENLLRTSGRGLLLMRSLMDEVRYSRAAGAGTRITLLKHLPESITARNALRGPAAAGSPVAEHSSPWRPAA